jgi:UDP-4-amino-4,6-dideoxy-N-acetyl-beta-L-altrosamine transaminase
VIPYGKQDINKADIDAVVDVLKSDYLTQGPQVPLFEQAISTYCSSKYVVAVNSATSALHISCLALGLGKDDWLWTSPNSFVASANCGLYCGAKVDFIDIDPLTYNLSVVELEKKLIKAKNEGKLPKIVIPVHFAGQSCDMSKIKSLSQEFGFSIIEDASHAVGSKYLGKFVGGCQYSDITVFSFHPVKIITTAEGGVATTNSHNLAKKLRLFHSHGITRDQDLLKEKSIGPWYYEQISLGFNYRMTELQAALGISQLKRVDKFVSKRHALKKRYDVLLEGLPLIRPYQSKDSYSALHLYPVRIGNGKKVVKSRKKIFNELRVHNIGVNVHYIPIHMQPYFQNFGFKQGDFPNSEAYYESALTLPLFSSMTSEQQDEVVTVLKNILQ